MKLETVKHLVSIVAPSWIPVVISQDYVEATRHIYADTNSITVRIKVAPANRSITWDGNTGGGENMASAFAAVLAESSRVVVAISNIINTPEDA